MNILQVSQYMYFGGGISFHVMDLSRELSQGHDVDIVTFRPEQNPVVTSEYKEIVSEDPYYGRVLSNASITEVARGVDDLINGLFDQLDGVDVVHLHISLSLRELGKLVLMLSKYTDVPVVVTVHTSKSTRDRLPELRWNLLSDSPVHYISVSEAVSRKLNEHGIRSSVIKNGVDTTFFEPGGGQREGLLFVGRNVERKGIEFVYESAGENPDILHKIVSENVDEKIRKLPNTRVFERITRGDLLSAYQNSVALLLPSKRGEGLPLVLLEAMACGTPVIVSDAPGASEIISESRGIILNEVKPSSIRDAFHAILADDYMRECRELASEFRLSKKTKEIVKYYKSTKR